MISGEFDAGHHHRRRRRRRRTSDNYWLPGCGLLTAKLLQAQNNRTGIGPVELPSLDAVRRIKELFSQHLIGATLGAQ